MKDNDDRQVRQPILTTFTCERCGFQFDKETDFPPHLCYRCIRFLGKGTWKLANQIQPPLSRTNVGDV